MKHSIDVLAAGTPVRLGGDIRAVIAAVSIRQNAVVSYQVVWWDGRSRHEEWVWDDEVEPTLVPEKVRVGFAR